MSLGKIFINGIYTHLKRLIFASDRVTDMQFRNDVLNGNVIDTSEPIGTGTKYDLTDDELGVFCGLAKGRTKIRIAEDCLVSVSTVSNRIKTIQTKFNRL